MSYRSDDNYMMRADGSVLYRIHYHNNSKGYRIEKSTDVGFTWLPDNSSVYPLFPDAASTFDVYVRKYDLVREEEYTEYDEPGLLDEDIVIEDEEESVCEESVSEDDTLKDTVSPAIGLDEDISPAVTEDAALMPQDDAEPVSLAPAFDYGQLDATTAEKLRSVEDLVLAARRDYVVTLASAVAKAHELVANCDELVTNCRKQKNQYSDSTFIRWCEHMGLRKNTAYRLLQVNALLTGASVEERAVLEQAPQSLLYEAAKPSAPPALVQGVKDGDITTHKQYKELAEKLRQAEAGREAAVRSIKLLESDLQDTYKEVDKAVARAESAEKELHQLEENGNAEAETLREKLDKLETRPVMSELYDAKKRIEELEQENVRISQEAELDRREQEDANAAALRFKEEAKRETEKRLELEKRVENLTIAANYNKPNPEEIERLVQERLEEERHNIEVDSSVDETRFILSTAANLSNLVTDFRRMMKYTWTNTARIALNRLQEDMRRVNAEMTLSTLREIAGELEGMLK